MVDGPGASRAWGDVPCEGTLPMSLRATAGRGEKGAQGGDAGSLLRTPNLCQAPQPPGHIPPSPHPISIHRPPPWSLHISHHLVPAEITLPSILLAPQSLSRG